MDLCSSRRLRLLQRPSWLALALGVSRPGTAYEAGAAARTRRRLAASCHSLAHGRPNILGRKGRGAQTPSGRCRGIPTPTRLRARTPKKLRRGSDAQSSTRRAVVCRATRGRRAAWASRGRPGRVAAAYLPRRPATTTPHTPETAHRRRSSSSCLVARRPSSPLSRPSRRRQSQIQ
jgi:hypothetical protein